MASLLPPRPGRIALASLAALAIATTIAAVLIAILLAARDAQPTARVPIDLWHLLRMSALQAAISTALSLFAGMALAWSLDRLRFRGRELIVGLFATAIVTPGIVVAFGLLTVWGRNGWINRAAETLLGTSLGNFAFGLFGIVLAHVVLNAAFAARILYARLETVPANRLKLGQSLGLDAWRRFRHIDWPAMSGALPGLGAIIFLLTFTSFPIVLLLGGGPANQTLEVAIFTAVRQNFDLPGAVQLALVQILIATAIVAFASALPAVPSQLGRMRHIAWSEALPVRALAIAVLAGFALVFITPLIAILVDGLSPTLPQLFARPAFWRALGTSLAIGSTSALLTIIIALILALGRAATPSSMLRLGIGLPAYAYLAAPAVVLSLGFFLLVRNAGIAPANAAPAVVITANALLALPFAMATLAPPLETLAKNRGRLIRSLGIGGWRQLRAVELPLLGRDIGVVIALAFCFSLGDLGVIALFGTQDFETLPLMMYRALGSYRSTDAASIAAVLLLLTLFAFIAIPRLVERLTHARG